MTPAETAINFNGLIKQIVYIVKIRHERNVSMQAVNIHAIATNL